MTCLIEVLLVAGAAVAGAIGAIGATIGAGVLSYLLAEMISILLVLGYLIAIPVTFFIALFFMPFVIAIGLPILGPVFGIKAFIDCFKEWICGLLNFKCLFPNNQQVINAPVYPPGNNNGQAFPDRVHSVPVDMGQFETRSGGTRYRYRK